MKPPQRAPLEQLETGFRTALAKLDRFARRDAVIEPASAPPAPIGHEAITVDVPREFHRRLGAIIEAVQTAIWQRGVHELLGYTTDFAFGQQRGVQTLVLKTGRRSAYVRLHWDTLMGESAEDRQRVADAVRSAIQELA